jgi:hypothetical protein
MLNRTRTGTAGAAALTALLLAGGGCGRRNVRAPESVSSGIGRSDAVAQEAADRKELVEPAPPSWRPRTTGTEVSLHLSLKSSRLHAGDAVSYRLEIQNTGAQDVGFYEAPSFIKSGFYASGNSYSALLTLPDGRELELPPPLPMFSLAPSTAASKESDEKLFLTLRPGETLATRPDETEGSYRALRTSYEFEHPGRYSLRFVYDKRRSSGVYAESNAVVFEVLR